MPRIVSGFAERLEELNRTASLGGNRLFYLATPPNIYPKSWSNWAGQGWQSRRQTDRGRGSSSRSLWARRGIGAGLNRKVLQVFEESQVYRIDHYLGKETVQNLLVFVLGTESSSRCGTAITSTTCKLQRRNRWE